MNSEMMETNKFDTVYVDSSHYVSCSCDNVCAIFTLSSLRCVQYVTHLQEMVSIRWHKGAPCTQQESVFSVFSLCLCSHYLCCLCWRDSLLSAFTADVLTCQSRKGTGVNNNINDNCIPVTGSWYCACFQDTSWNRAISNDIGYSCVFPAMIGVFT